MATKKATKTTSAAKNKQTSSRKTVQKAPAKKVEKKVSAPVVSETKKQSTSSTSYANKGRIVTVLKKPQIIIPLAVLLAVILVYLLKSWFVVAVVNGQFITRPSLDSALEQQDGKQVLTNLITEKLLQQEAAKKGISVNQSDIDTQVKKIQQQLASQGQTLDQALAAQGMTKSQLEDQIKLQTILQKLLGNQISVSDKEINDYIAQNKDSLPTGESDSQLKATVKQQLQQQKLTTAAQSLVQKLQSQAKITYFINL